jgi:uncharacterized protein (DUF1684 family)
MRVPNCCNETTVSVSYKSLKSNKIFLKQGKKESSDLSDLQGMASQSSISVVDPHKGEPISFTDAAYANRVDRTHTALPIVIENPDYGSSMHQKPFFSSDQFSVDLDLMASRVVQEK